VETALAHVIGDKAEQRTAEAMLSTNAGRCVYASILGLYFSLVRWITQGLTGTGFCSPLARFFLIPIKLSASSRLGWCIQELLEKWSLPVAQSLTSGRKRIPRRSLTAS
jgi:hypothetical protein